MFSASQIYTSWVRGMKKRSKTKYKEGEMFDPTEEGTWRKCSRGRRSYSRLLSPFHLQLPLCFPEPSPGRQTPLSTSASSTSSSRGICPEDMLASEAWTGATAQSRGPWGVLSHTRTYFAQLYGEIRNNNNTSSCSASLGALALGHDTKGGGGVSHTHCRHPASSWVIRIILVRSIASQVRLDFWSVTLKYWLGLFSLSAFFLFLLFQCLLELGTYLLQVLVKTSNWAQW